MERLHGPINPCLFGEENFGPESIERETVADAIGYNQFVGTKKFKLEEEVNLGSPSLDDTMPFLQMLQSVDSPAFSPYPEPKSTSFQLLLRLQNQKQHEVQNVQTRNRFLKTDIRASRIIPPEPESCLTHDVFETQSPVKSDNSKDVHGYTYSNSVDSGICPGFGLPDRERRKRKRTRPPKNREEVETQRMTHIAVERNRRRQMNDHLSALRSLMPSSYAHRGDQASIIGGAIDFVKELEQLLETLQAQKRMRNNNGPLAAEGTATSSSTSTMQCVDEGDWTAASSVGVSATVIQNHVNLKVECERRGGGQAVKAVVALEELRLTVLHVNISSYQSSVHYSFSLKVEDDCKLRTADEIIGAVQEIFSFINGGSWVTLV